MREIKFRGQDCFGNWQFGSLVTDNQTYWVIRNSICDVSVDPKTVGQYTGLKDKNGVEIYEGDALNGSYLTSYGRYGQRNSIYMKGIVKYLWSQYCITNLYQKLGTIYFSQLHPLSDCQVECEVISNIHDNSELLK